MLSSRDDRSKLRTSEWIEQEEENSKTTNSKAET